MQDTLKNLPFAPQPRSTTQLPPIVQFSAYPRNSFADKLLGLFGWRVQFVGLPGPRGVLAVYPHTSNWDFPIGLVAKWSMGLPFHFWGKSSLFKFPIFGRWLRWVGGIPIDRQSKNGKVAVTVREMMAADFFWFAVAPEGTRKRAAGWKSGFYRVALEAGVPIGVVYFDYPSKTVSVMNFVMPSGDVTHDMARMALVLEGRQGFNPSQMSPMVILDTKSGDPKSQLRPQPVTLAQPDFSEDK